VTNGMPPLPGIPGIPGLDGATPAVKPRPKRTPQQKAVKEAERLINQGEARGADGDALPEVAIDGAARALSAPPYGYVRRLLQGREIEYGASSAGSRSVKDAGTRLSNAGTRSLTDIIREIRRRRKLLVTPPIPPGYRKTTQVVRAGQALFADLTHRLPAVLTAKPMTVQADPVSDDEDAQETATLKEEWTTAVLLGQEGRRSIIDNGKTSMWRDCMDNLVNAGRCSWSLNERLDRWSEGDPGFPKLSDYEDDPGDEAPREREDGSANPAHVPKSQRRSRSDKYLQAVQRFKRQQFPFTGEHLDPLSVYLVEDGDGVEDEAIVIVNRPYRETLAEYGLVATEKDEGGPYVVKGDSRGYRAGPMGFGKAYPLYDAEPDRPFEPQHVETVTYYCSARRALWLGLAHPEDKGYDPDCGVWSHYVDGVCVAAGPLLGPHWHPLPVFRAFGLSTSMGDPTYTGVASPMHLIELIDLLDQIITMELHVAFWSSFPPLVEEDKSQGAPGAAGMSGDTVVDPERGQRPDQNRSLDGKIIEPGRFYSVPAGRTWRYLVLPAESTAHLERLYAKASSLVDLIGIPSVFRGQGGGGQAGYAIAQLMIAARSLYGPVVENFTAQVAVCIQYLWWQVWRRFPEGVPVYYPGMPRVGRKKGWKILTPKDIAPDAKGAGMGTPFLACGVKADPLLPVDEAQLEMRGIQAQQGGAVDMLTMRERYFNDPAPERTEARVLADKINTHPLVQECLALRGAVRQGVVTPEMGLAWLEAKFGIPAQMAFDQLLQIGTFTEEEALRLQLDVQAKAQQAQMQQAQQAMQPPAQQAMPGGAAPGMEGMGAPGASPAPGGPPPPPPGLPPGLPPGGGMPPPPGSMLPGPIAGGVPGQGPIPAIGMAPPGEAQAVPMPAVGTPMLPPGGGGGGGLGGYAPSYAQGYAQGGGALFNGGQYGGFQGAGSPMGSPGNQLPMATGGALPGTPNPPPGVPALPGRPVVSPYPQTAPAMGPPPTGTAGGGAPGSWGTPPPPQSPWGGPDTAAAYGAETGAGGGAAIPGMQGVPSSMGGMPQNQPDLRERWRQAMR
jgi:hypothetical protein